MRKFVVLLAAFGLLAAGCGGSGESCGDIADDAIALFQDVVDEMDSLTTDDLLADEPPAIFDELEEKATSIDERATEASCSDEELGQLVADRSGSLESTSDFGAAFIAELESGSFFE